MEEEVALLAWNLEADVAEVCPRSNGLTAFAADDNCAEFHKSLPSFAARPCRTRTIDPCLRYRKWKGKDDNGEGNTWSG
jgi:hypothetical protein